MSGLEAAFDHLGRLAVLHRQNDPRVLSIALALADVVTRHRQRRWGQA
jgi:hypothetical protein